MKGYNGKILRLDLTERKFSVEYPPEDYYKQYLGGRGFIIHTLLTELPPHIDPLGPQNKLIFAVGPMTGYPFPGSGRNSIGAKSPLSGGYGESEVGGFWGAELKRSGYDAIIVEGISSSPVYLWIENEYVQIRDASKLWGLEVADTVKTVQEELGDSKIRVAAIGPAGERLVRYASISNDISHIAGRMGMGAVMGSKKLKAIAVRGNKLPEIADRKTLVDLSRWMGEHFREKAPMWQCGTGTIGFMKSSEATGNLAVRNYRGGTFPTVENITAHRMVEKRYLLKMDTCFSCPIRCKKRVQVDEPWHVDPIYGGPEYETLTVFGSNCGVDDLEAIIKANELCNRYGMDTISTGVCISFAMECFEKGILSLEDTDGLDLSFGNAQVMVEMVKRIGSRMLLGNLLAEGTRRASQQIGKGSDALAMHVKGVEIPMHEPRLKQGMGLHYSLSPTGPDHNTGIHDDRYIKEWADWDAVDWGESIPSQELSPRKTRMVYHLSLWRHLSNHLVLCIFVPWNHRQVKDAVESITGWPMSYWKLMKAAERGITLARIFNIREGFSTKEDTLPKRLFNAPSEGPLRGVFIDPDKLEEAHKIYYQMLGWNEMGIPTTGRLVELNIEWAARYLEGANTVSHVDRVHTY